MNAKLPDNVLAALTVTQRATGWNFRPADTLTFDLPNPDGTACRLLVVPYRRWAYRRQEQATAAWWREQGTPRGAA